MDDDLYRRLCRARELMDDCYDQSLDVFQLSREACISPFHFIRLFKQAFSRTPHQYLTHRRIERAKELLSRSTLTVTDVCYEVGFQSLGSFSTLFHRLVGQPPIAYRSRIFQPITVYNGTLWIPRCFSIKFGLNQLLPSSSQF